MFNNNHVYNLTVTHLFDCGAEAGVIYTPC